MAIRPLSVASWGLIGGTLIIEGPLEVFLEELEPLEVFLEGTMINKVTLKQGEAKNLSLTVRNRYGGIVDLSDAVLALWVKRRKSDTSYIFSKVDADFDKSQSEDGIVAIYLSAANTNQGEGDLVGELECSWPGSPTMNDKSVDFKITIERAVKNLA